LADDYSQAKLHFKWEYMINDSNFLIGEIPKMHPKSTEYREFWREQKRRCIEGYTVGGKYMPPELYFYVNFGTIELYDPKLGRKKKGRPMLRDIEWEFFRNFQEASNSGKGLLWIAGRRGGKSYSGGILPAHRYTFFPDQEMVVSAELSKYSNDIMRKVVMHLDGLKGTPFYHQRIRDSYDKELRSGFKVRTERGWEVKGYNSRIYNITFKDDHTAANGKSAGVFIFEEIGMFSNLDMAYNSAEPCWKEGSHWFGTPVLFGTGGDMERGSIAAQKMFYDPDTYNLLKFEDDTGNPMCMFTPGWKCLNDYKRVFRPGEHEEADGITLLTDQEKAQARVAEIRESKKKSVNKDAYYQEIQYYPNNPGEAFLQSSGNRFPVALLQEQLDYVLRNTEAKNKAQRGSMIQGRDGVVKFIRSSTAEEAPFPFNPDRIEGCVTIYEHPEENPPYGLYIGSNDPYREDESKTSDSLGSTFIYKRFRKFGETHDWLVAEWTGRPETTEQYDEQLRLLCKYFNARLMFENEVPGTKLHFQRKNCDYLLCDQPTDIIRSISPTSEVSRTKGCHATRPIKLQSERWLSDWLREMRDPETGRRNLHYIYSANLLKELINYNPERGNFDRVSSMFMMMIHMKSVERILVEQEEEGQQDNPFAVLDRHYGWGNPDEVAEELEF
jgi:hypothetical protein